MFELGLGLGLGLGFCKAGLEVPVGAEQERGVSGGEARREGGAREVALGGEGRGAAAAGVELCAGRLVRARARVRARVRVRVRVRARARVRVRVRIRVRAPCCRPRARVSSGTP